MTPSQILTDLKAAQVIVEIQGENLRLVAPKGVVGEELRREIARHKPELIALLTDRNGTPPQPEGPTGVDSYDDWKICETPTHNVYESYNAPQVSWVPPGKRRGLIGLGFPPRTTSKPPPEILAAAVVICQRCKSNPVLPELSEITSGLCWDCRAKSAV